MASNATSVALPSPGAEKVKFTVFVRGHQWSSARHIHETLQEFAEVIQRNARRLNFIDEGDNIQRLQLARTDGSDPEELDVDATLEDVIICMGSKQLVAIITSPRGAPAACSAFPEGGKPCTSPILDCGVPKLLENDNVSAPIPKLAQMQCENLEMPSLGPAKSSYILKHRNGPFKSACDPGGRGLKITIPSMEHSTPIFHDDRGIPFGQDYGNGDRHAAVLPPAMSSRSANLNGSVICGNGGGIPTGLMNSASTPSPAELAHFLVRGSSSIPANRVSNGSTLNGSHMQTQGNGAIAAHHSGFQSFAPAMMNRLPPMPTSNNSLPCQAPATPNIALLAQFLASQLRAFIPVNGMGSHHNNPALTSCPANAVGSIKGIARATDLGTNLRKGPTDHLTTCCKVEDTVKKSPRSAPGNPKASVSESHDKDESSSSANVNNTAAPSSDGIESELQHTNGHRRSEMIFLVNRRSKTGVGTHHLRMSDLSAFFHLSVVDAAKKLGVSQTTLKKACRKFGLKRWPGRKVRSLESTIHGLEHTIAVGHGAGMEELTEAYMRSEVTKLQQEMDQLVHGTPISQHSPVARTADLYKRLYSRGWRSKYHSPCNRFDLDLNRDSRDTDQAYSKAGDENKPAMKGENGCHLPRKEHPAATDRKDDSHSQTSRECQDIMHKEQGNGNVKRSSNMDLDNTIREDSIKEDLEPAKLDIRDTYMAEDAKRHMPAEEAEVTPASHRRVDSANHIHSEQILNMETQSGNSNHIAHAERPCAPERSPKRPKRDCSDLSDAALHELSIPL